MLAGLIILATSSAGAADIWLPAVPTRFVSGVSGDDLLRWGSSDQFDLSGGVITYQRLSEATPVWSVPNLSGQTIRDITVCHKGWDDPLGFPVGGPVGIAGIRMVEGTNPASFTTFFVDSGLYWDTAGACTTLAVGYAPLGPVQLQIDVWTERDHTASLGAIIIGIQ